MKSKVIIFCVLLFCSKFVVSIPFAEESIPQRTYQPTNWQGNQNIADHYHGNAFAQAQGLNSGYRHDHSHEIVNQGRQNYNNYGFNSNPSLQQQSLPSKDREVNFASDSSERKSDSYPVKGDNFPIRSDNQPIRIGNQQYRPNNWEATNRFVSSASSASATATAVSESETSIREPYRAPGQHSHYNRPAINPPDRINSAIRDIHYHPVAERPNVRYFQHTGPDSESNNRPHVHYENFNEGHAAPMNVNVAKPNNNVFVENSVPVSNSQAYEGYNGPPAIMPDTLKNTGNYQAPQSPRNTNIPNTYNIGRPSPSKSEVSPSNNRYLRNPIIDSAPKNQVPTNTVLDNIGNIRYSESGPKPLQPINNYRYVQNPTVNQFSTGPDTYNAPSVPSSMEFQKHEDNPVIDSVSNYQAPVNTYNDAIPIDSSLSSSGQIPLTDPVPVNSYRETQLLPIDKTVNKDNEPINSQPVSVSESKTPSPTDVDVNLYKSMFNQLPQGLDRETMEKLLKKSKKVTRPQLSRYMVIHPNGTVEYVDDMDQFTQSNRNYVVMRKNRPIEVNKYKSPPSSLPPRNNPASNDRQPIQNKPEVALNKTEFIAPLPTPVSKDSDNSQPSGSWSPSNNNGYPSPPILQSPISKEYYPSSGPQSPTSNEYYPSSGPQSPTSNEYFPSSGSQSPTSNEYYPSSGPQSPTSNDYYPTLIPQSPTINENVPSKSFVKKFPTDEYNPLPPVPHSHDYYLPEKRYAPNYNQYLPQRDYNYQPSPPKVNRPEITPTNKAPDGKLLQAFLDSLSNKTDKNPPSDVVSILPTKNDTDTLKDNKSPSIPNIPKDDYNSNSYGITTPPSKLPTIISPGIFTTTKKPTWDDNYTSPPLKLPTVISPGIFKTTKNPTWNDNNTKPPVDSYTVISPGVFKSTTKPSWDDNVTTSPSILSTRISPDVIKTTPKPNENDLQDFLDSISGIINKNSSPIPSSPNDKENKEPLPKPLDTTSNDNKDMTLKSNENNKDLGIPLDTKDDDNKKPPTIPLSSNGSSDDGNKTSPESQKYKPSQNNDYTTPSSQLPTVIPNVTSDEQIKQFLDLFYKKPDEDKPSKTEYPLLLPVSKGDDFIKILVQNASDSNSPASDVTISPVEKTTQDQIITISPIELATDNINYGTSSSPVDKVTSADETQNTTESTPSQKQTDKQDDVIITVVTNDSNNTTNNAILTDKDIKTNNVTESATNDYIANTDVPATSDDNSTVATNSIKQSDVYTGDNSTSGDNLLESISNTSDITILLNVPNDSDGNITIKIEVPDSTGIGDTGDDTLVVNINTKNCSDPDFVTATKFTSKTAKDEPDANKNIVIDLSNSTILFNKTADKDFFNQSMNNATVCVMYIIHMQPQPIIERTKETTIFANKTVMEVMTETTWQNKDDDKPTVLKTTRIYHQD